jgi:hypothetical protein
VAATAFGVSAAAASAKVAGTATERIHHVVDSAATPPAVGVAAAAPTVGVVAACLAAAAAAADAPVGIGAVAAAAAVAAGCVAAAAIKADVDAASCAHGGQGAAGGDASWTSVMRR